MMDGREVARALMALDDETFARVVATGDFERLAHRTPRPKRAPGGAGPATHRRQRPRPGSVAP